METTRSSVGALLRWVAVASALIIGGTALPASAVVKNFMAVINGGQEVPLTSSNSLGVAYLTFDTQTNMLCYSISFSIADLSSAETASHFHGPAVPGVDGVIIFPIPEAGSPKNGCVGPWDAASKRYLMMGRIYLNIHTANNLGGEIRGQVVPVKGR